MLSSAACTCNGAHFVCMSVGIPTMESLGILYFIVSGSLYLQSQVLITCRLPFLKCEQRQEGQVGGRRFDYQLPSLWRRYLITNLLQMASDAMDLPHDDDLPATMDELAELRDSIGGRLNWEESERLFAPRSPFVYPAALFIIDTEGCPVRSPRPASSFIVSDDDDIDDNADYQPRLSTPPSSEPPSDAMSGVTDDSFLECSLRRGSDDDPIKSFEDVDMASTSATVDDDEDLESEYEVDILSHISEDFDSEREIDLITLDVEAPIMGFGSECEIDLDVETPSVYMGIGDSPDDPIII